MYILVRNRLKVKASVFFIIISLAGCSAGPDFVKPKPPQTDQYNAGSDSIQNINGENIYQDFEKGAHPIAHWWELFGSQELNNAVVHGLDKNFAVKAAQANLKSAQENYIGGSGIFYPQANANISLSRENFMSNTGSAKSPFSLNTASISVGYNLDIAGGAHRTVEALGAQVDQQDAIRLGTYLMLTGHIVNTLIGLAELQDQTDLTEKLIALLNEQSAISEKQYLAGTIPYAGVLAINAQAESFKASLAVLKGQQDQKEHLLATLEGESPQQFTTPKIQLEKITLPQKLPISLPSELVHHRPDILEAEAQLHIASANVGIATAALYPGITLNANFGQGSESVQNILDSKNKLWGIGLNLTAPLLNGGALRAHQKAALANYDESLANYQQTVINAFSQVADSIRALQHDAERSQALNRGLKIAQESLMISQANYQSGTINYLQMLIADIQYHQAMLSNSNARAQALQDTTALFLSLGGGWDAPPH